MDNQWDEAKAGGGDDEEDGVGPFVTFVLLNSATWDSESFRKTLKDEWGLDVPDDGSGQDGDGERLVWEMGDMLVTVALMPAPVPDGEAEHNAATNYLWPDAVAVTKTHVAHLLVAVLPRDEYPIDAGRVMVQLTAACLEQASAIGVYASGTVFEPAFYREAAAVMHGGELPLLNWIYFGFARTERGFNAYTYGMKAFGKDEMEVLDSGAEPAELRDFLFNIAAYVLESDTTLQDGETLGSSEEERIPIIRSDGVSLDGQTLKIGYRPVS